ncbi:MAG: zinc ribbon domain-containing protein [Anaerolineales bacterium]
MPLYEFHCHHCGETFTVRRPFSAAKEPAACPSCASADTTRAFATFACTAQGSGGESQSIGGGGCAGCAGGHCASCGH